jgi:hypothetical protein
MKNCLLIFFLVFQSGLIFSQIEHVEILVGKDENHIRQYLDSLNKLKGDKYSIIKQDVSDDGSLLLSVSFLDEDEKFYNCLGIGLSFKRIASKEICTYQRIYGTAELANNNLKYIKDNFVFKSENKWEKNLGKKSKNKIVATFERRDGIVSDSYVIDFSLVKIM